MAQKRPSDFVRVAANLIPKELLVKDQTIDGLSDQQLGLVIERMKAIIAQHEENLVDVRSVDSSKPDANALPSCS
jgi:hypothetical protein